MISDRWTGPDSYERFMGRWSRALAREFLRWLARPPQGHWLEVGCGTGALTSSILDASDPASVVAADPSETFVDYARSAIASPRVRFVVAGADRLPPRPDGYDVVVSLLVVNFLPDPPAALAAMRKLATERGVVAASVWDYPEGMEFLARFWGAAVRLDPEARRYDERERFAVCSRSGLAAAFGEAGFEGVDVDTLEIRTRFRDFEDYWEPFVGGPGPAPGYLSTLSPDRQRALAAELDASLPRGDDGAIDLSARAWAVRAPAGSG